MATYTDKFSSGWATLKLIVTREAVYTSENKSKLKAVLQITKNSSCYSSNNGGASISMTIAGDKLYSSNSFDISDLSVGSTRTLVTKYKTVTHNGDGTKSVTCKASFSSGVGLGSASISATYTCGTIPRASTFALDKTSVDIGGSIKASITRHDTDFTHSVRFYIDSTYTKTYSSGGTSQTFNTNEADPSWYNAMPNSTSCTAYCKVTTKNGSSTVGDPVTKSFTVKVPTSIKPSVSDATFTVSAGNVTINNVAYTDFLVQGKNKLTLNVSGATAGTGSSIDSYIFTGPGLSTTTTSSSTSIDSVSTSGSQDTQTLTYQVVATDKRGRSSDAKTGTITYYKYNNPSVNLECTRNETSLTCKITPTFSKLGTYNTAKVKIYCGSTQLGEDISIGNSDSGTPQEIECTLPDADTTYQIKAVITDGLGSNSASKTITSIGSERIFNVNPQCNGIAFGKKSEYNPGDTTNPGVPFDVKWNALFRGDITVGVPDTQRNANITGALTAGSANITGALTAGSATVGGKSVLTGSSDSSIQSITIGDWKLQWGTASFNIDGDTIKTANVNFPTEFAATPYVFTTAESALGAYSCCANTSKTGTTINCWGKNSGSSGSRAIRWFAVGRA